MFGTKKVLTRLDELEKVLEDKLSRLINLVNADERLAEMNKQLMDRLMSKNWQDYVTYQDSPAEVNVPKPHNPLTDEDNAGEILSDEELGK